MTSTQTKNVKKSITELVGNTPLLQLTKFVTHENCKGNILAKLEFLNPTQSSKDRIALAMIEAAEQQGLINEHSTIIETTSGNTGIGVAALAAAKGLKAKIYMQEFVSIERTKVIQAYGTEVISFNDVPEIADNLEALDGDFVGAVKLFKEVIEQDPNNVFLNQIDNENNANVHYATTGPEIYRDVAGDIDIFIAAVGTGGTISGVGKYLKEKNPAIQIVAVEPSWESVATVEDPEIPEITGVHRFSDVESARIPSNVHQQYIDDIYEVSTDTAKQYVRKIAKSDGLLVGLSSGAALAVAHKLAQLAENQDKQIVVLFPDTGLRYLSTDLF